MVKHRDENGRFVHIPKGYVTEEYMRANKHDALALLERNISKRREKEWSQGFWSGVVVSAFFIVVLLAIVMKVFNQ